MNRAWRIILAVFIVWGVLVSSVCLGESTLQLLNNSGRTISEIWIGPSSNPKWTIRDKVIKDGSPLGSGKRIIIDLGTGGGRYWDLRVDFAGGGKKEWHEIDMWSDIYQIEITRSLQLRYQR